jgi:hypothetical protein
MRSIDKVKKAFQTRAKEERSEVSRENKKRSQDAFAAHLSSLDELLRESDDLAEQFVKTFNDKNEEMEEEEYRIEQLKSGGMMNAPSRRKVKPLPPYWGSGFNRQAVEEDVSVLYLNKYLLVDNCVHGKYLLCLLILHPLKLFRTMMMRRRITQRMT